MSHNEPLQARWTPAVVMHAAHPPPALSAQVVVRRNSRRELPIGRALLARRVCLVANNRQAVEK